MSSPPLLHPSVSCLPSSPQMRMSFIVFSTDGRTLMALTEDRYSFTRPLIVFCPLLTLVCCWTRVQGQDPGWTGGAADGAARRRHLHGPRVPQGEQSVMSSEKRASFGVFTPTDVSKTLPQASEQIYYATGDGESFFLLTVKLPRGHGRPSAAAFKTFQRSDRQVTGRPASSSP